MTTGSKVRVAACLSTLALALAIACSLEAPSAMAKSEVFDFSNYPTTSQAGAHPNLVTAVEPGTHSTQSPLPACECDDPKDITTHAPAGVIANPHVVSECTAAELATTSCPPESQLGVVVLRIFGYVAIPLYRTVPQAGQAGLFAFLAPIGVSVPQHIVANARTGSDYGLDLKVTGIEHSFPPSFVGIVTWGVPGAAAHDPLRFAAGEASVSCSANPLQAIAEDVLPNSCEEKEPHPSSLPVAPLVQNPTTCTGPLTSKVEVLAYDGETTSAEAPWPETTGCDKLSFNPSLAATPTTSQADSPSGLAVDIKVPQFQDPETPSPSEIRGATVSLPAGFTINPNAADGKSSCTDSQANFSNESAAECPEYSKIGTTTLDSSALPGPIDGYVYLGEPRPGDLYRIILTASGFGTNVKIAGSIHPDPLTGQLVTTLEDLPQAPFQAFDLHFFGSERGLLATPTQCGAYAVHTVFKPWAQQLSDQTSTQFFELDSGPEGEPCPDGRRPFGPTLEAGVEDATAGLHSPFDFHLSRQDGDQFLTGLSLTTPPGFSATLRGIPYCSEAEIARLTVSTHSGLAEQAAPSCPAVSQIGTAIAGVGAGTRPLYVPGKIYLAGPYKGAPLSLEVVIPAVSGPYDLGNIALRAALHVDPLTAQVTAVSDPLPQIVAGIPLRTRFVEVDLDRPGFALNPTNCDPFSVQAQISGDQGTTSAPSTHFQVANCGDLRFAPKFRLKLSGGLRRRGHPAIHAVLSASPGEANIHRVSLTLPPGELIDNAHIGSVCTRTAFAAGRCPPNSAIGDAEVTSPLLDNPLRGPVYLRSSSHDLPDLALDLGGQFQLEAAARIDRVHGLLRTTFPAIPDVPVSRVVVDLAGGSKGLLQNSTSLCGTDRKATVSMKGQNGKSLREKTGLRAVCAAKNRQKRNSTSHHTASTRSGEAR